MSALKQAFHRAAGHKLQQGAGVLTHIRVTSYRSYSAKVLPSSFGYTSIAVSYAQCDADVTAFLQVNCVACALPVAAAPQEDVVWHNYHDRLAKEMAETRVGPS